MQISSKLKTMFQFYKKDIHLSKIKINKSTLHITGASCISSFFVGTGKLIIGVFSMSFFTCASALYTYAIVIAKGYVLYGITQTKNNVVKQYDYYQHAGKLLIVAGTAYIVYSIKLLFYPSINHFDQNMALGIAFFTFVELGLNIRGIIVERKNKMPLFHALKIINLASSCICLVLTQTAILAYTSVENGIQNNSSSNGIIGILMGGFSTVLGVFLFLHAKQILGGKDIKKIYKKMRRMMNKNDVSFAFEPIAIGLKEDGKRVLQVEFKETFDELSKQQLYNLILDRMNLVIVDKKDILEPKEVTQ